MSSIKASLIMAGKKMSNHLLSLTGVEKVEYKGSLLNVSTIDKYSDVDMDVYVSNDCAIDFVNDVQSIFAPVGDVFAFEIIESHKQDIIRLCFSNGDRFDLTIIYPVSKKRCGDMCFAKSLDKTVNEFWFHAVLSVVKIGRMDNLTAAHLALGLYQQTVVIQMLVRDSIKGTNIHRYGDNEHVPAVDALVSLADVMKETDMPVEGKILRMIFAATGLMDELMLSISKDYIPRNGMFHEIYENRLCGTI